MPLKFSSYGSFKPGAPENPWEALSVKVRRDIVEAIYRVPKTITQLAKELKLSQAAIHKHINVLLTCNLIKEVEVPSDKRRFKVEKFYSTNFPIALRSDREKLDGVCRKIAKVHVDAYKENLEELKAVFDTCSFKEGGWSLKDAIFYIKSTIDDLANEMLSEEGLWFKKYSTLFFFAWEEDEHARK